ncbi:MAG: pyridoxamine 5'-phosphate oxidase family protein [Eubacteriales bacterium]|nr:pyridoxamine 5'-phosphate oxidase family protein [Eubacteriales bacterium]
MKQYIVGAFTDRVVHGNPAALFRVADILIPETGNRHGRIDVYPVQRAGKKQRHGKDPSADGSRCYQCIAAERKGADEMYREMRRFRQQITEEDCRKVLEQAKYGVLALVLEDGQPYAVPLNYYYDGENGRIYFHGAGTGQKIDALRKDARVCFNVVSDPVRNEGEWWRQFDSVTVFGRILAVEEPEEKEIFLRKIGSRYYPTSEAAEAVLKETFSRVTVLELVPEHMTGKHINEK